MDSSQLQALIQKSTLLTETERAYWLQQLPTMTPPHIETLEAILAEGETIHIEQKVQDYFTAVKQAAPPLPA
ncbi:MAG: hypothetical protein HOO67_05955 [Candidatus Peribacteraceae bacterium]|nr:hypothetical protein [Candidatus Peribacteraceae bacterium]